MVEEDGAVTVEGEVGEMGTAVEVEVTVVRVGGIVMDVAMVGMVNRRIQRQETVSKVRLCRSTWMN